MRKRITFGKRDDNSNKIVAEVGIGKDGKFFEKIRYYRNLTSATIGRLNKVSRNSNYGLSCSSWGTEIERS